MDEVNNPDISVTDENGYYSFNNLPLYTEVDGETVVCGYKVKIEELPAQYAVTSYHESISIENEDEVEDEAAEALFDNDLNDKTGYLEMDDALIILAQEADEATPLSYNIDGFNISYGNSVQNLDAGLIPYGVGSIQGVVFEDANENGIFDDDEQIFEGETVYLDYYLVHEDGEGEFTSYQNMQAVTAEDGSFIFDYLPVLDENNEPYQYRIRMQKPAERDFTKAYAFEIMGQQKANILIEDAENSDDNSKVGITPVITLAVEREDENFYNLKYQLDGYNHTNAYLAFDAVEESEAVYTGNDKNNQWIIAVPVMALGLGIALIIGKKRRKETN